MAGDEAPREGPEPDRRLDELAARSGFGWPARDDQLDAWLATQSLAPDEEAWLRDVVRRRTSEAQAPGGADHAPLGTPVPAHDQTVGVDKAKGAPPPAAARASTRPLSSADLALLDAQLVELVAARVPLPAGLAAYAEELGDGALAPVAAALRADLEAGLPLSEALARRGEALPPLYRALVASGELTGDLAGCLALLHEQAQTDADLDRRLRDAVVYPGVAGGLSIGALLGAAVLFGPQVRALWGATTKLPPLTAAVLEVSDVVHAHPLAALALTGATVVGAARFLAPRAPALVRRLGEGPERARSLSEVTRALSGFVERGVPLPAALATLREAYPHVAPGLEAARLAVEGGATLSQALAAAPELFPPTYTWFVGAAEARGDLAPALRALAARHDRLYRRRLRLLQESAGPAVLAVVGLLVLALALIVFLPLFELQKTLQS